MVPLGPLIPQNARLGQADRIRANLAIMYGVVEGACAYIATDSEHPIAFLLSNALHLQFERLEHELRDLVSCGFY